MKSRLVLLCCLSTIVLLAATGFSQTSASMVGSVKDPTGATIANAEITVTNAERGITRTTTSNADGEWAVPALPAGKYDLAVTAAGFKKYQAQGVTLEVAQKARIDVAMQVGAATTEVTVEGASVAQVDTQSSDLAGTVTGKEISQLQLNGRNFTQLVTTVPGVSNQTGQDEGTVGVSGNVGYSINGGRIEYNNWELDGGDNMDNGSNTTLNVYPSLEAIGEFKVLTSNYGAQYGRNGSGTVEVETKSGTSSFHGSAYEYLRNDAFNANNVFNGYAGNPVPEYKKHDFGYTIGGPVFIPKTYNREKQKTFFFWSQEWRRDRVPGQVFNLQVPSVASRSGNFTDICQTSPKDCPTDPSTGLRYPGDQIPFNPNDVNVQALLALIPEPNAANNFFTSAPIQPTTWREELIRVDHNLNSKQRVTFRYIHDSWDTVNAVPLWTNVGSFPTVQTNFKGPGVGLVTRLTSTFTPTLLNEFVFSYTADHIILNNVGAWKRPAGATFGSLFPTAVTQSVPGIDLTSVGGAYNGSFGEDPGYIPNGPYNSNPTYTYRDNMSKIVGRHNLQFGAYVVTAQKNEFGGELSAGSVPGYLQFNPALASTTTGNPLADLELGYIYSFGQQDHFVKYYNRYKIVEPYFQDDYHVTSRLTLNLGLRLSLFGTYRERYHQAFNFDPARYIAGQTTVDPTSGSVTGLGTNPTLPVALTNLPNGIVQCGVTKGVPVSCMQGHLFNPAPRIGFAFDPKGDGKTAIRGGYGIFYEHTNGNEGNSESLENSPPLANTAVQNNIVGPNLTSGYPFIGTAAGQPAGQLPLTVVAIPTKAIWPYVQQWHFDVQHDLFKNTVVTVSYVGSKGTHLTRVSDYNQLAPVPLSQNPYSPGEAINTDPTSPGFNTDCTSMKVNGNPVTGQAAINLGIAACGANPDVSRTYPGYHEILRLQDAASSIYHALQISGRRQFGGLTLSTAYTYGHSIDDSSSRQDGLIPNSFNPAANRASSNFDQRHIFDFTYVWDLPFFKGASLADKLLGGWRYSGITTFSTGSPFSVTFPGDNAGVANGATASAGSAFADRAGDPNAGGNGVRTFTNGGYQFYNPAAFVAPRGLTFGDSGRNILNNPHRINFDMSLMKDFKFKETAGIEFWVQAFNIFNHGEWGYIAGDGGSGAANSANLNSNTAAFGGSNFLQVLTAHNPRILQLSLKFFF
jgi:hypothetical protein